MGNSFGGEGKGQRHGIKGKREKGIAAKRVFEDVDRLNLKNGN